MNVNVFHDCLQCVIGIDKDLEHSWCSLRCKLGEGVTMCRTLLKGHDTRADPRTRQIYSSVTRRRAIGYGRRFGSCVAAL